MNSRYRSWTSFGGNGGFLSRRLPAGWFGRFVRLRRSGITLLLDFAQHGGADRIRHPPRGGFDWIVGKMGVAGGRLHLAMAEQLADHRQTFAQGEGAAGVGMPKVMDAHIIKPGLRADAPPGML